MDYLYEKLPNKASPASENGHLVTDSNKAGGIKPVAIKNFVEYMGIKSGKKQLSHRGFTLTELLVAAAVLAVIVTPLIISLIKNYRFTINNKERLLAESIASEKIEIIRNLDYSDVGTDTGWPHGEIPANPPPETRNGIEFQTKIDIRYFDDDFDGNVYGTVPDKPVDLYPYDYKKIQVKVFPVSNPSLSVMLTTNVSPSGPETETDTGILEIRVIDASGQPIEDAEINITNLSEGIDITTTTAADGKVLIPALPPDEQAYHVVVSKLGYSTDQTYEVTLENPYPEPTDQSVLLHQLTSLTLSIDKLSTMNIYTKDVAGQPITDPVTFEIKGAKIIGYRDEEKTDPIYKFQETLATENGSLTLASIEWDSYTFNLGGDSAVQFAILNTTLEPPEPVYSISFSLPPNNNLSFDIVLTTGPAPPPPENP